MRWSLTAALILHLVAGIVLSRLPSDRRLSAPQEDAIPVEVLVAEQLDAPVPATDVREQSPPPAVRRSAEPARDEPRPRLSSPDKETADETGVMIRAAQLLSTSVLANPRSRRALEGLRQLAASERIVQLCNLEAMEQVHRWRPEFQPDFLIAYAMGDPVLSGTLLRADGGALRSQGAWYNISYRCEVSADLAAVAAFEFAVGREIPTKAWEAHSLTADDGAAD
ncbi:DUF930 domain-containing protein [Ensifer sp. LCM 4579]|uniref:DUF930 domain-containing protein n=1 Tax=Ensifer sp. LCM 4579 TaxID=1848292 RepID=UPI0008D9473A|nr:DUF930 domain-containing protein [Ensifer sp. LCM 4579]OHV78034.1 hypothetical protein LCM4579_06745 [Ensifer sp. LCM 4579]